MAIEQDKEPVSDETAMLDMMEDRLEEMRGDDSYDDKDSYDDTAESINERETQGAADEEEPETDERKAEADSAAAKEVVEEGAGPAEDGKKEPEKAAGDEAGAGEGVGDGTAKSDTDQDAADDALFDSFANERTKERFQQFRNENKELKSAQEQLQSEYDTLRDASNTLLTHIEESQTSTEQLSTELSLNRALNTGDYEAARPAYERMKQYMAKIAIGLGEPVEGMPLPENLQTAVDNLDITPDLARRQAALQAQQQLREHYQQQQQQREQETQQQQQQREQVTQKAVQDIRDWEQGLMKSDADFTSKQKQMLEDSKQIMDSLPPDQWLPALQQQYGIITKTQQRIQAANQRREPSPVRPGVASGGSRGKAQPKNFEDNLRSTLQGMRGAQVD